MCVFFNVVGWEVLQNMPLSYETFTISEIYLYVILWFFSKNSNVVTTYLHRFLKWISPCGSIVNCTHNCN